MYFPRLAAVLLAFSLALSAESLSVAKLVQFLESSATFIQQGKMTDRELAGYLARVKMTERLDDRTLEDIQGRIKLGPKTLQALKNLRDESANLGAGEGLVAPAKPKPIPPPSSVEQAAILDDVREYALNYSRSLPDFICTQVTRRFAAPPPGTKAGGPAGSDPHWYPQDTLQIRLSFFHQKEQYTVVLIGSQLVNKDYSKVGGAKSFGEFGSMMQQIFEPATEAHFEWDHWGTLRGQRVMAFSYHIRLDRSKYQLVVDDKLRITAAYHGLVEVDPKSHAVLRITAEAENIPSEFPLKEAKDVLDYDYTELSGQKFLLPLKAQVMMKGSEVWSRLDEEFRVYRKYSAESDIKFDTEPIAPLPDDKTKETPAAPSTTPPPAVKKTGQ
jgi:hypothetical protein